jgi:hypothetical protein
MRRTPKYLMSFLMIVAGIVMIGCTPEQVEAFKKLDPATQQVVIRAIQERQAEERQRLSTDCRAAMRAVWPSHLWSWAERIMQRESTSFHAAANSRSTARGCWQLLSSLHADKYSAVGCHVSQWADALCNNKAAYRLYQIAGPSPWRLTNY